MNGRYSSGSGRKIVAALLLGVGAYAGSAAAQGAAAPSDEDRLRAAVALAQAEAAAGRAWIGVWLEDAVDGGVQIVALAPGGPAAVAELREGDIILSANTRQVSTQDGLSLVLADLAPGDVLELVVLRNGESIETDVQLGARTDYIGRALRAPAPPRTPRPVVPRGLLNPGVQDRLVGLDVADVTPALREHYGAPPDAGVLVVKSDPEHLAARAGVQVGDVLVRVGDEPVTSGRQLSNALARWNLEQPLGLLIVREGESKRLELTAALESQAIRAQDRQAREERQRETLERRLELEIERLELRIRQLRRELERLELSDEEDSGGR